MCPDDVVDELRPKELLNTRKPIGLRENLKCHICGRKDGEWPLRRFVVVQYGLPPQRFLESFRQQRLLEKGVVGALLNRIPRRRRRIARRHQHLVDDVNHAIECLNVFMEDGGSVQQHGSLSIHGHGNVLAFHRGKQSAVLKILCEIESWHDVVAQSCHHAFREVEEVKRIQIQQFLKPFDGRAVGKKHGVFFQSVQAHG